jgi:Ala-tRNA(Pro) deacylase
VLLAFFVYCYPIARWTRRLEARYAERLMDLTEFLAKHGIHLVRHEHPPVMTVEESLRLVPKFPGAKTKNLFPARQERPAPFPRHRAARQGGRHRRARGRDRRQRARIRLRERLQKHLGIKPGSVSLLALVNDEARTVEFILDKALWDADAVHAHPLVNTATMVIRTAISSASSKRRGHPPRVIEVPAKAPR